MNLDVSPIWEPYEGHPDMGRCLVCGEDGVSRASAEVFMFDHTLVRKRDLETLLAVEAEAASSEGVQLVSTAELERLRADLNLAYRERCAVVAALIRVGGYPAQVVMAPDAEGWWIVYAETPAGQVSWHVSPDDMDLFRDIPVAFGTYSRWDGHTTDEKYRRVAALAPAPADKGATLTNAQLRQQGPVRPVPAEDRPWLDLEPDIEVAGLRGIGPAPAEKAVSPVVSHDTEQSGSAEQTTPADDFDWQCCEDRSCHHYIWRENGGTAELERLRAAAEDVVLQEGRHRLGPTFATVPKSALDALEAALAPAETPRTIADFDGNRHYDGGGEVIE